MCVHHSHVLVYTVYAVLQVGGASFSQISTQYCISDGHLDVHYFKTISLIYFKFTVFNTNAYGYLHTNFLSNPTRLKSVNFNFNLTK